MEFWFSELHTGNVKLSVRIEKQLFSGESEYQRIDVFDLRGVWKVYFPGRGDRIL